ncbi:MAG: helix-turn-helix domain-containing protein [Bacteroidales bacterium]|nr:helix-turn-helix domain-containing protein [Bacteroidales bacterium]
MKRKINHPDVAVKLSIKAYREAVKLYNKKQEQDFLNNRKTEVKTVKSLFLKEEHHQVFYTIINYYKDKLETLNQIFNGSDNIMTHIAPKESMMLVTGRLAKHLQRANNTIRARLRRLEKAGIIKVIFHGNKKPLEIIFNKNICIIYDKANPDYIPKSNFISLYDSDFFGINSIKVNDKESTFSGTIYNNTITKRNVLPCTNHFKSDSSWENVRKKKLTDKLFLQNNFNHTEKISGTAEKAGTTEAETSGKRKKVPEKKEKINYVKIARERRIEEKRRQAKFRQLTKEEKKELYKIRRTEELKRRKAEALEHYSYEFYAYLIANIFPDKYLTPHYRRETHDYISKHSFSKARTIRTMDVWLKNYKKRIDISKKWIEAYRSSRNERFDTTYFFPKAYLNVEKYGRNVFSFVNTRKFIKNEKDWEKKNGYNRNTEEELRHKLNKTARELENGLINYDTALERVKSLTNKTDEYVKQLHARYFGIYKTMQKN